MHQQFVRVLIVDDEPIFQTTLKRQINWEENGFLLVGFASDGREALTLIHHTQPQIVITDIAMPVMDGVALTREIKAKYPAIGVIVLSNFNTFDYAREAMRYGAFDYILKSELTPAHLLEPLRQLSLALPTSLDASGIASYQFLLNLISGCYSSEAFVQAQLEQFHFSLTVKEPVFLARGTGICAEADRIAIADIRGELSHRFSGEAGIMVFSSDHTCYVLGRQALFEKAVPFLRAFADGSGVLLWGVLPQLSSVMECGTQMHRFAQFEKRHFYAPTSLFMCEDPSLTFRNGADIDFSQLDLLVQRYEFDPLRGLLDEYYTAAKNAGDWEPYQLKETCKHAVYRTITNLEQHRVDVSRIDAKRMLLFREIEGAATLESLHDKTMDTLLEIEACALSIADADAQLVRQIDAYFEANFDHEIRLSDVASQVHLSYHYLSRLLNAVYGETFNDHLNRIRIEKAQDMLLTGDESIAQVAAATGFSDQGYFSKIFKKYSAVSPKDYRRQRKERY